MLHGLDVARLDCDRLRGMVTMAVTGLHAGHRVRIQLEFPLPTLVEQSDEAMQNEALDCAQKILRCAANAGLPARPISRIAA